MKKSTLKLALIALLCISCVPIAISVQRRLAPAARELTRPATRQLIRPPEVTPALSPSRNVLRRSWYNPRLWTSRGSVLAAPKASALATPKASVLAAPKRSYGGYRGYGQANQQKYQPNYRLFAGVSLAAATAALQQRRAQSLANEYTCYEYVNAKGYRKKVIFLGDVHVEQSPHMAPYIDKYRKSQATQALQLLVDLKQIPHPVTFFIEVREWDIQSLKEFYQALQQSGKGLKMSAPRPAIIEAVYFDKKHGNITYIPFDKRSPNDSRVISSMQYTPANTSPEDFAELTGVTFEQRDQWLHDNLAPLTTTYQHEAQKIIDATHLPPPVQEELEKINSTIASHVQAIATQPFDYKTYANAYLDNTSLVTDTALTCDLYNALEREGDETIVLQCGSLHIQMPAAMMARLNIKPVMKVAKDPQYELGKFIRFIAEVSHDPDEKDKLVKSIPGILGEAYLKQQGASSPEEILGAYVEYHVKKNTVTDFRTPLWKFINK